VGLLREALILEVFWVGEDAGAGNSVKWLPQAMKGTCLVYDPGAAAVVLMFGLDFNALGLFLRA
jgi:hypothetical protein